MCGIFGVRGHDDAVGLTKLGLFSLQHRGQESSGIVAVEHGAARGVRSMGLVSDMPLLQLEALRGTLAIGHTRYSTAGSSTSENAQPVLVSSRGGHIALAHNGNLTNAGELRVDLEESGSIFASSMDSEVIVHRLARSAAPSPEEKLVDALRDVEGAYSLLISMADTLLAARDPRGWRPLVLGRLNGAAVFASETCALDIVGATFIQPGQASRVAKVRLKFSAVREVLDGKRVVMVDDSIVRGTTTRALVSLVRGAGAREVHMRVSSAPVTGPCYYGIDTPSRDELIAATHNQEESRDS